jgi:hypothetical protein
MKKCPMVNQPLRIEFVERKTTSNHGSRVRRTREERRIREGKEEAPFKLVPKLPLASIISQRNIN